MKETKGERKIYVRLLFWLCHVTWLIFDGKIIAKFVAFFSVTDWGYAPSQNACLSFIFLVNLLK